MRSLHILRSIWIWAASSGLILLWAPLLFVVWLFECDPRRVRTGRWFRRLGRTLAKLSRWRILVSGLENVQVNRAYVIVSNHQSLADIPVIAHLKIDTKWLAKAELFRVPVLGWMLRMAGDIPVERSDRHRGARTLVQCAQYLRQRCSVVFFPEGTRSCDGQVLPFAEGPFKLAIREQVPILPLVVEGSANALPKNSWVLGARQDIHLHILPTVSVAGCDHRQSASLRDHVRQKIVDELQCLRRTWK
jgi:1-acyl-sn-glycerol-3-phosphate acyltransferase